MHLHHPVSAQNALHTHHVLGSRSSQVRCVILLCAQSDRHAAVHGSTAIGAPMDVRQDVHLHDDRTVGNGTAASAPTVVSTDDGITAHTPQHHFAADVPPPGSDTATPMDVSTDATDGITAHNPQHQSAVYVPPSADVPYPLRHVLERAARNTLAEYTRPRHACLLVIGRSSALGEMGALLIELAMHAVDGTYAVPGGILLEAERDTVDIAFDGVSPPPSALLGAAREWHEEVLGLEGDAATLAARTFLQEAIERGGVRGPYGDVCASGHAAYLYEMRHEDDIDRYASLFVANAEAASLLIVPAAGLRADYLTASTPHGIIALRDKIGYMRVQAIKQRISNWRSLDIGLRAWQHLRVVTEMRAKRHAFCMIFAPPPREVSFAVDDQIVEFEASQPPSQLMSSMGGDDHKRQDAALLADALTGVWMRDCPAAANLGNSPGSSWERVYLEWIDAGSGAQVWMTDLVGNRHDENADKHIHAAFSKYLLLRAVSWAWNAEVALFNPMVPFLGRLEQYFTSRRARNQIELKRALDSIGHAQHAQPLPNDTTSSGGVACRDDRWQPQATSVDNRSVSAASPKGLPPAMAYRTWHSPRRYSSSPYLAPSLGHELESNQVFTDSVMVDHNVHDLAPPAKQGLRPTMTEDLRVVEDTADAVPPMWYQIATREFYLPLPEDFEWPYITHFAFHENNGCIRESWRERGYVSASVADRRSSIPPSEGCYHFVGQVYDMVQVVPYPIEVQTNHVECGAATWSSWKTWPQKLLDGRMREAAEELLWINSIGNCSMGEQPHTAHEHTVGPPTQVFNAYEHGEPNKTWCVWIRNGCRVNPTNIVPPHLRTEVLSAARGTAEERMLMRSSTSPAVADAITEALDSGYRANHLLMSPAEASRPASQPCASYAENRRAMFHNLGILAASCAPRLSSQRVLDPQRTNAIAFIVPLAPAPSGPAFMVPLQEGQVFGIELSDSPSHKEQVELAATFLSIGIETHYIHGMHNAQRDIVVAAPWDVRPVVWIGSVVDRELAASAHQPAAWCTLDALIGSVAHEPALFATQRCLAMGAPVWHDELQVGIWQRAKPAVLRQRARHYGTTPDEDDAERQWEAMLVAEAQRKMIMQADLLRADGNADLIASICEDVRTAADFAAELPRPPQGLPQYVDPILLDVIAPERPLPLHRDWLHRLPPQALPPGFQPLPYVQALRQWSRRLIASNRNKNMRFDAKCLELGHAPPNMRRPEYLVLGKGAACAIPHADGIGTYNPMDLLLEQLSDGTFGAVDFTVEAKRKWVFDVIEHHIGTDNNNEMLSFLFHGVRWKLDAPRQIRLGRNLQRFDNRAAKVGAALSKLEERNYVTVKLICKVTEPITEAGPNPLLWLPMWECGVGGIDRSDGDVRPVGDCSAPHGELRERNRHDGEADGPVVVSFNDLSGPKGGPKEGYTGPLPFPEPEPKPRPRHKYTAAAYLSYYAKVNATFVVSFDDDLRQCFFQFFISDEDRYLINWQLTIKRGDDVWLAAVNARCMNQGARNSSKIACNFGEEWLDAWRRHMDAYVATWLPEQSVALHEAYAYRMDKYGMCQARPFWAAVYTDNFDFTFASSELAAHGMLIWKAMNRDANIWLQDHVQYGTCTDWIGGRCAVTAGFGCVTPSKRARAIERCTLALQGRLSREDYESNNSFLGHVNDICDWPANTLTGITGPLKIPGFDEDMVVMTPIATEKYQAILLLLRDRPLASFWSGVTDAFAQWAGTGTAVVPINVHATDCCTDPSPYPGNPSPQPHVAGMVNGLFWRFRLEGEWLERHITLTEATGPCISTLTTVPRFPDDINVLASDATAALAAGVGSSRAEDLQQMRRTLQDEVLFDRHAHTTWYLHWKGWGNGITDALSRDNVGMARRVATAFGITLTEVPIPAEVHRFMWSTLVRTRPVPADAYQIRVNGIDGLVVMMYGYADMPVELVLDKYKVEIGMDRFTPLRAIFAGKQLDVQDTLCSVGVGANDTIHLVASLNGGGLRDISDPPSPLRSGTRLLSDLELVARLQQAAGMPTPARTRLHEAQAPERACPLREPTSHGSTSMRSARASPVEQLGDRRRECRPPHPMLDLTDIPEDEERVPPRARAGSPQPTTAAAARRAAVVSVAEELVAIDTEYAICPDNPSRLRGMIGQVGHARHDSIPRGTKKSDEWGFRKVMLFCRDMGPTVRWMRPKVCSPHINVTNEVWFTSLSMFWIAHCAIDPSARRRAKGYTQGMPPSALLAIYGYRRVMRDCGRYLCDMAAVHKVLKALCEQYKRVWGAAAFDKQQAQIFSNDMLLAIQDACVRSTVPGWSQAKHDVWKVMHPFKASTGTRNNEDTEDGPEDDNIRRENFVFIDGAGSPIPMTPENIARIKNGDLLRGTSGASKCDRLNVYWSKQKQYFRYDDKDPMNYARAWQIWELKYPCPEDKRGEWPAFSATGDATPITSSAAAYMHKELLTAALGASIAADRTLHSYRATLASKFAAARAAGIPVSDGTIQIHLRWRTLTALQSYLKLTPSAFADNTALAARMDAGPHLARGLPEYEPHDTLFDMEQALEVMSLRGDAPPGDTARAVAKAVESVTQPIVKPKAQRSLSLAAHEPAQACSDVTICGAVAPVRTLGADTWGIVGIDITLPNEAWGETDGEFTECQVEYFLGKYTFPNGSSAVAYAVSIQRGGDLYAMRADFIARHLTRAQKASIRKKGAPRAAPS